VARVASNDDEIAVALQGDILDFNGRLAFGNDEVVDWCGHKA